MPKFCKRPIEIEAMQYNGGEPSKTLRTFLGNDLLSESTTFLIIRTLEGSLRANEGDFIIRGVAGEHYPCKPEIFWATYELVT